MKAIPWAAVGVVVGFTVGLLWGRETSKSAANHVTTKVDGTVITVRADIGAAARQGLAGVLADLRG